ncbi:hypothetical protein C8J56DRAFT_756157, partial [Mycena floridula]
GCEGGRFHILDLGVWTKLTTGRIPTVISFNGLHFHGGTPPIAPPGQAVDPSDARFSAVMYPPKGIFNGDVRFPVG